MKKAMRINNVILIALASLATLSSCNGIDKLIKSRDYEKQYSEALKYYDLNKNTKAIRLFSSVEPIYQGTDRIDTVKFYTAKAYYREGDYEISSQLFDEFRKTFTRSTFAEESEFLYAMSFYESSPNPELDQNPSTSGIEAFNEYLERYPDSPKKEACLEMIEAMKGRLYLKSFVIANTYYNVGYYNSAIHSYKNTLKKYPNTPHREEIMFLLVKSNYLYAKASVIYKQRERYLNTIDAYYNFISEYPESKHLKDAERLYKISNRMSNLRAERELSDSTDTTIETRKIERQEMRANKIADKADSDKVNIKESKASRTKTQKAIDKKIAKIEAKIDKEKKKEAEKKLEEQAEKILPTEISATGNTVLKDTDVSIEEAVETYQKKKDAEKDKAKEQKSDK